MAASNHPARGATRRVAVTPRRRDQKSEAKSDATQTHIPFSECPGVDKFGGQHTKS